MSLFLFAISFLFGLVSLATGQPWALGVGIVTTLCAILLEEKDQ